MKRVNYHLTDDQLRKLRQLSKSTGLSVAEIIRRAVDRFIIEAKGNSK
jgi:predicted DNA-binding protein